MKKEKILDAMEYIDEKLIEEAVNYKKEKRFKSITKWGVMAACLGLALMGVIVANNILKDGNNGENITVDDLGLSDDENSTDDVAANQSYVYVEPLKKKNMESCEWIPSSFENEIEKADTIVKCTIIESHEICFLSENIGGEEDVYETLLKLKVTEIHKPYENLKIGDEITICEASSSRAFYDHTPDMNVGDEYYFFLKDTAKLKNDNMKLNEVSDFYTGCAGRQMYPVKNGEVEVSELVAYDIEVDGKPLVENEDEYLEWHTMKEEEFLELIKE